MRHLKAFPVALKQHLRGEFEMAEFAPLLETREVNELSTADNLPLSVCTSLSMTINSIKKDDLQTANNLLWWLLEDQVSRLSQIIADCERLVRTPVPLEYAVHTSRLLSLWVGTLGVALALGWLGPRIFAPPPSLATDSPRGGGGNWAVGRPLPKGASSSAALNSRLEALHLREE